jgi:CHAT domain-containing protein/tetratricopeptide (TPR) repeat protein
MIPRSPATARKSARWNFRYGIIVLLAVFLTGGRIAAQETRAAQEEAARKLITEAFQPKSEDSTPSLSKAIEKFEAARVLCHSFKNVNAEADLFAQIGFLYDELEQHQEAIENYRESLPLYRVAGDKSGEAASLFHLGLIQGRLGEKQGALDTFSQAVVLYHAAGDAKGEAAALVSTANVLVVLGDSDEALIYYKKGGELFHSIGFREGEALVLMAIGAHYNLVGDPAKARETVEQGLAVSRAARFRGGEAAALVALGLLHSYLLDIQKALEYYEQALPIVRAEHDRAAEAVTLDGLCASHISSRNYEKGFEYCAQALALIRANGDRAIEAGILKHIAIGERNRGNFVAAQTAIESAITIIESIRTKVINPAYRLAYSGHSQDYYAFYIDLLMRLHKQHPDAAYDGKALQVSERARARSLRETLMEANADIRQGVGAALLARERETQRLLNAGAQSQMELLSRPHSETQVTRIADEIETLIKNLQQIETEIRQTSPHYAALMQPQPLTLREIQSQVLDQDTLLLEYSLGDERSYLWLVSSTSVASYELAKRDEIETAGRRFYNLVNARNRDVKGETSAQRDARIAQADSELPTAAASLSRILLGPVAGQLGKKRLMIVADGVLHFVSFAALPATDVGTTTKLLIADHEIVNLPSASTLSVVRHEVARRQSAPLSLGVLADPVFTKDDERVKRAREEEIDKETSRGDNRPPAAAESIGHRQLVKAALDLGIGKEEFHIPRLLGTRQEAEQISAMVPKSERRLALDFAASRDTATNPELSQYRYLHFSTHGFLNSVHPELSGLVLSLVNERGEEQDGFLRAHEIYNLELRAELVVLSACQTGVGREIRGEGLLSLTRGFMHAGAPRVLVSLWDVSDWGTTELMVRFYHGMLKEGMRPAAALRTAQISLMNDRRWASPYYWAPFTLQGEWR